MGNKKGFEALEIGGALSLEVRGFLGVRFQIVEFELGAAFIGEDFEVPDAERRFGVGCHVEAPEEGLDPGDGLGLAGQQGEDIGAVEGA